jgi:hypothetical protein
MKAAIKLLSIGSRSKKIVLFFCWNAVSHLLLNVKWNGKQYPFYQGMKNSVHLKCVLDYSIRGPLAPSISPWFYGWIGRGGPSSMVPEPRS